MTDTTITAAVIVHFDGDGNLTYKVVGGDSVRLFIVDERAPEDRVYEWLPRDTVDDFRAVIAPGEVIGSSADDRHAAIAARVLAANEGRPHLAPVQP